MAFITKEQSKTFQRLLNLQGADLIVDGILGRLTKAAMEAFEDGLMYPVVMPEPPPPEDNTVKITKYHYTKNVVYGETSIEVKRLQAMLKYQGFGKYLGTCGIDGIFGYGTRKGIEEYVRGRGLNTRAIEKTLYKTVTKEIWDMLCMEPYDIKNSKWTDEYMKCNCKGEYCDEVPKPFGVSQGLKLYLMRFDDAIKEEYGTAAEVCLTDDIGKNGGVRCEDWNVKCGGAKRSLHIDGKAADWIITGVRDVDYIRAQQISLMVNPYGGNSEDYPTNGHGDVRGCWSVW